MTPARDTNRINDDECPVGTSVVVPVYNGARTLRQLATEIRDTLGASESPYEVLFVDDGSSDDSWKLIQQLSSEHSAVRGVRLRKNAGQHSALLCGVRFARYSTTVTLDDDLQHPPREVPKLLEKLAEGYDVVYASASSAPHSRLRTWLSRRGKALMSRLTKIRMIEAQSPFRAFRTDLRRAFAGYQSPDVLLDALLFWGTDSFAVVAADFNARRHGSSGYRLRSMAKMYSLLLTGYSTFPLRIASFTGFFFTVFGLTILLYVLINYLMRGSIPGVPFLASIISIFAGAQLFAIGIVAEYLSRMYRRSLDRPPYVIAEMSLPPNEADATQGTE